MKSIPSNIRNKRLELRKNVLGIQPNRPIILPPLVQLRIELRKQNLKIK